MKVGILSLVGVVAILASIGCGHEPGGGAGSGTATSVPAASLHALAGGHARVVWCQQVEGDGSDAFATGSVFRVVGFDSEDGRGERAILDRTGSYRKPLLTSDGARIVYSDHARGKVCVAGWDGGAPVDLVSGSAVDIWRDPATGAEWVYVIEGGLTTDAFIGSPVVRVRLDQPSVREVVWTKSPVSSDNFQVAADGRFAGGLFPWPMAGVADLPDGDFKRLARGCWSSLAPDDSHLAWAFDGRHRNLLMFDVRQGARWSVGISDAPGADGFEVYHPRWGNHPRFLAMSGPYKGGSGANRIGAGGPLVEIYVGRFAADFRSVEQWFKLTANDKPDFFPDVWVDPAAVAAVAAPAPAATNTTAGAAQAGAAAGRLVIRGRLKTLTATPSPAAIKPYKQALVVYEYEVVEVESGANPGPRVVVSHWGIRNEKAVPLKRRKGEIYRLVLEPCDAHPELEGERTILDFEPGNLTPYYDTEGATPTP